MPRSTGGARSARCAPTSARDTSRASPSRPRWQPDRQRALEAGFDDYLSKPSAPKTSSGWCRTPRPRRPGAGTRPRTPKATARAKRATTRAKAEAIPKAHRRPAPTAADGSTTTRRPASTTPNRSRGLDGDETTAKARTRHAVRFSSPSRSCSAAVAASGFARSGLRHVSLGGGAVSSSRTEEEQRVAAARALRATRRVGHARRRVPRARRGRRSRDARLSSEFDAGDVCTSRNSS